MSGTRDQITPDMGHEPADFPYLNLVQTVMHSAPVLCMQGKCLFDLANSIVHWFRHRNYFDLPLVGRCVDNELYIGLQESEAGRMKFQYRGENDLPRVRFVQFAIFQQGTRIAFVRGCFTKGERGQLSWHSERANVVRVTEDSMRNSLRFHDDGSAGTHKFVSEVPNIDFVSVKSRTQSMNSV